MKKDPAKEERTSWGGVADWFDEVVEADGSYQKEVILPNLLRLVGAKKDMKILDLACGQGFFSRAFQLEGASVTGVDIGPELIEIARKSSPAGIVYHISSVDSLPFLEAGSFDTVTIVLAVQNIEHFGAVFSECSRVLKKDGRLFLILNHPAFRIPGQSSWGFDEGKRVQYRRVDEYLGESAVEINMEPGKTAGATDAGDEPIGSNDAAISLAKKTVSFHRPLQAYFKALQKSSLAVVRLEEWTSHKKSEKGPRQQTEDRARKEIPLFMMIEAVKIDSVL